MSDSNAITGAFNPNTLCTVSTTGATSSPTPTALTFPPSSDGSSMKRSRQFQLYNSGTVAAFVAFGVGTSFSATLPSGGTPGDYPVAPGAVVVVTISGNPDHVTAVTGSSTAVVYVTPGDGL